MQKISLVTIILVLAFILVSYPAGANQCYTTLPNTDDFVNAAISSDGSFIAAGDPGTGILTLLKKEGIPVWAYQTGMNISGVAISGNGEYISCVSEEGNVLLLDNSGNFLWESSIKGCSPKTVLSENGSFCLVYNEDLPDDPYTHTLHVFDENGTEFFSKRIPALDSAEISSDEKFFFIGTSFFTKGRLYSKSGELQWDYRVRHSSFIPANPRVSISDNLNLIGIIDIVDLGGLICFDKSGNEIFNRTLNFLTVDNTSECCYNIPTVYIDISGDGSRIVTGSEYIVHCINDTGSILWSFEFENATFGDIGSAAISDDGKLVAASCKDNLFVLDEIGEIQSKHEIERPIKRIFISDNKEVIAGGASGGRLYILSEKTDLISIDTGNLSVQPVPTKAISQKTNPTKEQTAPILSIIPAIALIITLFSRNRKK